MDDAWQILRDGGLPLATSRSPRRPTAHELAAAIRSAIATNPTGRDADALTAFALAWAHHWPSSFAAELGSDTETVIAWARERARDENRYLKLRRIALENLANLL